MAKLIRCECGFIARGVTDEEVIGMIRAHMQADHPAVSKSVGDDDLRGWIQLE
jgi:predicted small metal-binding protein